MEGPASLKKEDLCSMGRDLALGPGSCPFNSILRATGASLSSQDSIPLFPLSIEAQSEWVGMKFGH